MNQPKLPHLCADDSHEEQPTPPANPEIRALHDLELDLAGGGDSVITWP